MRRNRITCCLGLSLGAAAALPAQAVWSPVPVTLAPSVRMNHAGAYDLARARLVVFGGQML